MLFIFSFLLVFLLPPSLLALPCTGGQIRIGSICRDCPPGTYGEGFKGTYECQKCPPGTFNPLFGARDVQVCRPCPEDTFNPKEGGTSCTPCPPGLRSLSGAANCKACGPGTRLYRSFMGQMRCKECIRGTYSNGTANVRCELCPVFLTSKRGADSFDKCVSCPAGRQGESCFQCADATFKPSIDGRCEKCPPGHTGARGAKRCVKCPENHFLRKPRRELGARRNSDMCTPCPEGLFAARGSSVCRKKGQNCPGGSFEVSNGACRRCRYGSFFKPETKTCEKCPKGTVSKGGTRTRCIKCEDGKVPDFDQMQCLCKIGFFGNSEGQCEPCPAGTQYNYAAEEYPNPFIPCIPCQPGFFSNKPKSKRCEECPPGTVSDRPGSSSCKRCPEGFVPNFSIWPSDSCIRLESGCPEGQFNDGLWGVCVELCDPESPNRDVGLPCLKCGNRRLIGAEEACEKLLAKK